MPLSTLRYEELAVVTKVLAKLHKGGGSYAYATDQTEIEAATSDVLNRRQALILQTTPVTHPDTGHQTQHLPDNALPLSRGTKMKGIIAPVAAGGGMELIGRTAQLSARLKRAGASPIVYDDTGALAVGRRTRDRTFKGQDLGFGWLIAAGEDMHNVTQHTVTVGTATHTIDVSMGAGGMLSQWRTVDTGIDQQHLNMGGTSAAAMGFERGVQSAVRAVASQDEELSYTFNPRQGGDLFSPSMAGAWHTPPPTAAHVLLCGGAPVIRATRSVASNGQVTLDITTLPLDRDPDGRFWSYFYGLGAYQSMFAGGGYGRPAACVGLLMHTRWTFCWGGAAHIHRCDVWFDLGVELGDATVCERMPVFNPCEMSLRTGSNVNQECYVYDGAAQTRTTIHSNGTLWPTAGNSKSLVIDGEAASVRDPYAQVLTNCLSSGRGGPYFRSTDGSCVGMFAHTSVFSQVGKLWGYYMEPYNNASASPTRFVDPRHLLMPVSGAAHPRLVTPSPVNPKGVLGPFTTFVLTGTQAVLEANMRLLAGYREDELRPTTIDPFA